MTYANGFWVALGANMIALSSNGVEWTLRPIGLESTTFLAFGNGMFMTGSGGGGRPLVSFSPTLTILQQRQNISLVLPPINASFDVSGSNDLSQWTEEMQFPSGSVGGAIPISERSTRFYRLSSPVVKQR